MVPALRGNSVLSFGKSATRSVDRDRVTFVPAVPDQFVTRKSQATLDNALSEEELARALFFNDFANNPFRTLHLVGKGFLESLRQTANNQPIYLVAESESN